ncbi:MAG TPA: hypothetical protein VFS39_05520 [Nitrospira sp.]|nr:hypothetical protein [Nitrospira sp.]
MAILIWVQLHVRQEDEIAIIMALTRDDVLAIIAPADEMLVAEIIATEATMEELTQAWGMGEQR